MKFKKQFTIFGFVLTALVLIMTLTYSTISRYNRNIGYYGWVDTWAVTLDSADVDSSSSIEFPYRLMAKTTIPFNVTLSGNTDTLVRTITGTIPMSGVHTGISSGTLPISGLHMGLITGTLPISGMHVGLITGTLPISGIHIGVISDSLFITGFHTGNLDTLAIADTVFISLADTSMIADTIFVSLVDTSMIADTVFVSLADTTSIADTVFVSLADTTSITDTLIVSLTDSSFFNLTGTLSGSYEATTRYDYRYQAAISSEGDTLSILCTAYGSMDASTWTLVDTLYNVSAHFSGDTTFAGTFDLNGQNWPYVQQRWKDNAGIAQTVTQKLWVPKN